MGTIILLASIVVWGLSYFPQQQEGMTREQHVKQSYIGRIGQAVEPVLRPCGMEWKEGVSLVTGVAAKEIVASTMGVLYSASDEEAQEMDDENAEQSRLSRIIKHSGLTTLSALSFLIFILLYMPCIPACVSIKNESGKWRWSLFTIFYTTGLAWICSTIFYQVGLLLQ